MTGRRGGTAAPDFSVLRLLAGRVVALMGITLALLGTLGADISPEVLGIVLGLVGYSLGSRWLGAVTVVVSTVLLLLVLALMRGYVPGIEPTYPGGSSDALSFGRFCLPDAPSRKS